jgi:putative transposase
MKKNKTKVEEAELAGNIPEEAQSEMVVKKKRKLRSKTARAMMTWAFYQFSQTLEHLCNRYGSFLSENN